MYDQNEPSGLSVGRDMVFVSLGGFVGSGSRNQFMTPRSLVVTALDLGSVVRNKEEEKGIGHQQTWL